MSEAKKSVRKVISSLMILAAVFFLIPVVAACVPDAEPVKYVTISFETFDGTVIADKQIILGSVLELPPDPEKSENTFIDWFTDEKCTVLFARLLPVVSDLTLYALWLPDEEPPLGYINFGEYPASVADEAVAQMLSAGIDAGTLKPDADGYFLYNGERYLEYIVEAGPLHWHSHNGFIVDYTYYFKIEPLKWLPVITDGEGLLLITEAVIDAEAYNFLYEAVTWETSDLRTWLNGIFCNKAKLLPVSEMKDTEILNEDTEINNITVQGGNTTFDKVFLLSAAEITSEDFGFGAAELRIAKATDYALAKGVIADSRKSAYYRLRSPVSPSNYSCLVVSVTGEVTVGTATGRANGIRPAIYFNGGVA